MNATEYASLVEDAKQSYERDTAMLKERLERARKQVEREEEKLRSAQEAFAAHLVMLSRRFAGLDADIPTPAPSPPVVLPAVARAAPDEVSPLARGVMDEPLYEIAKTLPSPFSAPEVWEAWNAAHPAQQVTRSTVRGVMERHRKRGRMELVDEGGRGSHNPRTYKVLPEPYDEVQPVSGGRNYFA